MNCKKQKNESENKNKNGQNYIYGNQYLDIDDQ